VSAVGLTAQWAGTVAVDASGEPLHPAIIWMDTRGAPQGYSEWS
jgi:xylulokinase